ncbi:MAG: DUF962 domain-containing protein [Hahellaceae bacterium]|nr:DUF962 domain-containing protein [Hahellaceae bacterium]MCP5169757.1 DUF962 domain-containing protein [Hahellaceae bacterium]
MKPANPHIFQSFAEFYPYYLQQHSNRVCRWLHVVGLLSAISLLVAAGWTGQFLYAGCAPLIGYACSWTGHFVFEKNKPATFGYPLYSLMGDFRMVAETLGSLFGAEARRPD